MLLDEARGRVGPYVVHLRGWPGRERWRAPAAAGKYADRLHERNALVIHMAADENNTSDVFGLGAALYVAGPSVVAGVVIVPDELSESDPSVLEAIRRSVTSEPVSAHPGGASFEVVNVTEFFDPYATIGEGGGPLSFTPNAYAGAFVIGADLGRSFGLVAEHWGASRASARDERGRGGWSLYLPGWSTRRRDGRRYRRSPNRPELRLRARRVGWQVRWGPCGRDRDGVSYGRRQPGRFVDLMSLAYALDGYRGASFSEHRENFGLTPLELPGTVRVGAEGAQRLLGAVRALHETALALDERAAEWLTSDEERAECRSRIELATTSSPGALASGLLARYKLTAPLEKFDLTDDELGSWAESFHGGRCSLDEAYAGIAFPCAALDLTSAFPLVAHLLGWWELLTSRHLCRLDVTSALRELCEAAIADPTAVLGPSWWQRLGCTLVEVVPAGEPFPVEVADETRPDGRSEVTSLVAPRRPMHFAWPDVVAAAISSGHVPEIVRATRLVPVGREPRVRRRVAVLPGLVLSDKEDPALVLVKQRKHERDRTRAALLRVVVNSLCFGNLARFDECRNKAGRRTRPGERPGPWNFLPLASSVTAGSRLLLAVMEQMVRARGGVAIYCDTDSWLVLSSRDGGTFALSEDTTAKELSFHELDEIVACFEPLRVFGDDVPVWKLEREHESRLLWSIVFSRKRHVEFTRHDEVDEARGDGVLDVEVVERTEANLGGFYRDPDEMAGRDRDGGRRWSREAARREVLFALEKACRGDRAVREGAPWDENGSALAPALRRRSVVSPEVLASLPTELGARPGSRIVEAATSSLGGEAAHLVALEREGPWRSWRFLDRASGSRCVVSTSFEELDAVRLATLDEKAASWSWPSRRMPIGEVRVDPRLVVHVGRVSGVIDAEIDGLPGDPATRRPIYGDPDACRQHLAELAVRELGERVLARRSGLSVSVLRHASTGGRLRRRQLDRLLAGMHHEAEERVCECGCGLALARANQRWFSNAHRMRSRRANRAELR